VVAQVLAQLKVDVVHSSVLDCLADVMLRYVTELGKASSAYASVAGRSEGNLTDVLVAFGDVGLELSGDKGVMGYGLKAVEEPFNQPVPAYPVRKKQRLQLTLRSTHELPPVQVPAQDFLPILPPRHTHQTTATYDPARKAQRTVVLEQAAARQHAQRALVRLCDATRSVAAASGGDRLYGGEATRTNEQQRAELGLDDYLLKGNPMLSASANDAEARHTRSAFALAAGQVEALISSGSRQTQDGIGSNDAAKSSRSGQCTPVPLPDNVPSVTFSLI
jgi:hypothetical protein